MRLTEEQAARIVLVRAVEECGNAPFPPEVLDSAITAARHEQPGLGWVEKRAAHLFNHVSAGYRSFLQFTRLPNPWAVPTCAGALLLGVATNLLGPVEKIHVVRNPVFVLVAWNIFIYVALFVAFVLRMIGIWPSAADRGAPSAAAGERVPWTLRRFLPALWRIVHEGRFGSGQSKLGSRFIARLATDWFAVAGPLVIARWRRLLHFCALFLALGAVAGMYLRGLFQDYEVIWTSTFVRREGTLSGILDILFGPSLLLADRLGLGLGREIDVAALFTPEGDRADPWIHLFALTVLLCVVVPRASLALWQSLRIRKLRRSLTLPLDSYYGKVIEEPLRSGIEAAVEDAGNDFARDVTSYILGTLYDKRIVPALRRFRQEGGKLADLKGEIGRLAETFVPELSSYIAAVCVPALQTRVSHRVGELVRSAGSDFLELTNTEQVLSGLQIPAAQAAELGLAGNLSKAIGISVGAALSVAAATIGGGIGHHLGVAIIATLLGTTGPVGFIIGLLIGAIATAGAWLIGGEKLTAAIENVALPGPAVRAALWESRFTRLLEDGRQKFADSAQQNVAERVQQLSPVITREILARLRSLWAAATHL